MVQVNSRRWRSWNSIGVAHGVEGDNEREDAYGIESDSQRRDAYVVDGDNQRRDAYGFEGGSQPFWFQTSVV